MSGGLDPKKAYLLRRPLKFGGGYVDAMGDVAFDALARGDGYELVGPKGSGPAPGEKGFKAPKRGASLEAAQQKEVDEALEKALDDEERSRRFALERAEAARVEALKKGIKEGSIIPATDEARAARVAEQLKSGEIEVGESEEE
jgi:hypothetical protein